MTTNIYVTGSLLSVSDSLGTGGFLVNAVQRSTRPVFVTDSITMVPTGTLHIRRLAISSSAPIAIFEGTSPVPAATPAYSSAPDVFFYVSGSQGLTNSTADISVFGGDVVVSGSLKLFGSLFVSGTLVGQRNIRVVTGSWIAQLSDDVVITSGLAAGMTLTLPASPSIGQQFSLKDGDGVANTKNHTMNGNGKNIDGGATAVIVNPFTSLTIAYNGTQWSII